MQNHSQSPADQFAALNSQFFFETRWPTFAGEFSGRVRIRTRSRITATAVHSDCHCIMQRVVVLEEGLALRVDVTTIALAGKEGVNLFLIRGLLFCFFLLLLLLWAGGQGHCKSYDPANPLQPPEPRKKKTATALEGVPNHMPNPFGQHSLIFKGVWRHGAHHFT